MWGFDPKNEVLCFLLPMHSFIISHQKNPPISYQKTPISYQKNTHFPSKKPLFLSKNTHLPSKKPLFLSKTHQKPHFFPSKSLLKQATYRRLASVDDWAGIESELTAAGVEAMLLKRVRLKAATYVYFIDFLRHFEAFWCFLVLLFGFSGFF
jgi:hypothetical protein